MLYVMTVKSNPFEISFNSVFIAFISDQTLKNRQSLPNCLGGGYYDFMPPCHPTDPPGGHVHVCAYVHMCIYMYI